MERDRCDEGIEQEDAMMHLVTEGLMDRGAAVIDAMLYSSEYNA